MHRRTQLIPQIKKRRKRGTKRQSLCLRSGNGNTRFSSDLLKKYSGGESQNTTNAAEHFDQVAQAAPHDVIAEGLAAVFRSDRTPAFGNLVGNLFSQSSGNKKLGC